MLFYTAGFTYSWCIGSVHDRPLMSFTKIEKQERFNTADLTFGW